MHTDNILINPLWLLTQTKIQYTVLKLHQLYLKKLSDFQVTEVSFLTASSHFNLFISFIKDLLHMAFLVFQISIKDLLHVTNFIITYIKKKLFIQVSH